MFKTFNQKCSEKLFKCFQKRPKKITKNSHTPQPTRATANFPQPKFRMKPQNQHNNLYPFFDFEIIEIINREINISM